MKKYQILIVLSIIISIAIPLILINLSPNNNTSGDPENPTDPEEPTDLDLPSEPVYISRDEYIPSKIATVHYINLDNITRISRFRSGVGHDYSDNNETCRSMKHYYQPKEGISWTDVEIISPINGTIFDIKPEWAGFQIHIQSKEDPNITIRLFHVEIDSSLKRNDNVTAGQKLGTHSSIETMSDIAVFINLENVEYYTWSYFSYFEIMTDDLFTDYANYGISSLEQVIITREERDENPIVNCEFNAENPIENWVYLT